MGKDEAASQRDDWVLSSSLPVYALSSVFLRDSVKEECPSCGS